MKACLISVGNELLCGRTVDTNASWLSGQLFAMGITTESIRLVRDEIADIVDALHQAGQKADIVLVTGGLGPTDDDLTRQAMAQYMGSELVFHPELGPQIQSFFTSRGLTMPQRNYIQAYIPGGTEPIVNPCGTAPGVLYESETLFVALMPGVPSEMKGMFEETVQHRICLRQAGLVVRSANLRCFGIGESALAEKLGDRMLRGRNPLVNCTVSEGVLTLQIVASGQDAHSAQLVLTREREALKSLLGNLIFGEAEQTLQEVVGQLLSGQNKTLAVAESCTGGLIAKLMTDVSGSSRYFRCGWITYSNQSKIEQLGVSASALEAFGAVSEEVAKAMAQGAACKAGADCAIGITGIAGPEGGTNEKPVGLIYISIYAGGVCRVYRFHFANVGRSSVRLRAAQTALNLLRLQLSV